jgi:hypothetical protein
MRLTLSYISSIPGMMRTGTWESLFDSLEFWIAGYFIRQSPDCQTLHTFELPLCKTRAFSSFEGKEKGEIQNYTVCFLISTNWFSEQRTSNRHQIQCHWTWHPLPKVNKNPSPNCWGIWQTHKSRPNSQHKGRHSAEMGWERDEWEVGLREDDRTENKLSVSRGSGSIGNGKGAECTSDPSGSRWAPVIEPSKWSWKAMRINKWLRLPHSALDDHLRKPPHQTHEQNKWTQMNKFIFRWISTVNDECLTLCIQTAACLIVNQSKVNSSRERPFVSPPNTQIQWNHALLKKHFIGLSE